MLLYAMYCERLPVNLQPVYEINSPGQHHPAIKPGPTDIVYIAVDSCADSNQMQFQIHRGKKYGVAVIRNPDFRVIAFDKWLYLGKEVAPKFPVYLVIKKRDL